MPLQKQTISLSIANSINQKADTKLLQPNKLATSKNTQVTKLGAIGKRPGFTTLSTTVINSLSNPLTITTGQGKSFGFQHENQTVLQNNGAVYSRFSAQSAWKFKNHYLPVEVKIEAGVANTQSQFFADSGTLSGITVLAYEATAESSAGGVAYGGQKIGYCVIEESTGAYIVREGVISSSLKAANPKVVVFSSAIFITYTDDNNLKAAKIDPTTGAISATTTLRSDLIAGASGSHQTRTHDWTVTTGSSLGEVALFLYMDSSHLYKVGVMNTSGAYLATPGLLAVSATINVGYGQSIFCDPGVSPNRFFVSYFDYTTNILKVASWTLGASAYTVNFAAVNIFTAPISTGFPTKYIFNCTMITNPLDTTKVVILADTDEGQVFNGAWLLNNRNFEATLYYGQISTAGAISVAMSALTQGVQLSAKPFVDSTRQTVMVPVCYDSTLQATYFLLDLFKGNPVAGAFYQAKWCYGTSAGRNARTMLAETKLISGSTYSFSGAVKTKVEGQTLFHQAIKRFKINIAPTYASSTLNLGGSTHVGGGFLWSYDGSNFSEHSFFVSPETPMVSSNANGLTATETTVGSGFFGEQTDFRVNVPGAAFVGISGAPKFYTTTTTYYLWFKVDGVGTDPGGGTGILVSLSSTDTVYDVSAKCAAAITASGASVGSSVYSTDPSRFYVQNNVAGAVTASSSGPSVYSLLSLASGNYQYVAVWKWVDAQGRIYRSAPSVPASITTTGVGVAVLVSCPPLTNRDASTVVVELYRTASNQTTFRKVSSVPLEIGAWTSAGTRVTLIDTMTDATLASKEPLYTTGGVLENYSLPAVKFMATYKGRIFAAGVDDPLAVYYSKTFSDDTPIDFSAFNTFRVDSDGGAITGLAVMDERLVIFKSDRIYFVAGDPGNDLGSGSSLSQPALITADTGCVTHNSIVLYPDGLLFKSDKGIYKLARNMAVEYIGSAVESYNANLVSSAVLVKSKNEVRFTHQDSTDTIVYNYFADIWSIWQNHQSDFAFMASSTYTRVKNNGKVQQEAEGTYQDVDGTSSNIPMEVELPWLKLNGQQAYQRVYNFSLLGDYYSSHSLTATVSWDYDVNPANAKTYTISTAAALTGSSLGDQVYQLEFSPEIQKCEAIKVKFTENGAGQSATWADVSFNAGMKSGLNRVKNEKSS